MSSPGGRGSVILPSSGAGRAAIDPRGPSARGELPPRADHDEVQSALDRLSLSLERIHGLLEELQNSRRVQGEPSSERKAGEADLGDPEIRYGAGPSAFERREAGERRARGPGGAHQAAAAARHHADIYVA